jgi:hypothetical protein
MGSVKKQRWFDPPKMAEEMMRDAIGRGMSAGQCARLRLAFQMERGSSAEKTEAYAICKGIEAELRSGIEETVALEKARGGAVEEIARGPVRMKDRDGLHALLGVKDGLTAAEYDAGMEFRAGWELRSADIGSAMGAESTATGHDNDRFVFNRLQRAKKLHRTALIERTVAVRMVTNPVGLTMLRRIAGDGHSLTSHGKGRAFEHNLRALKAALQIADDVIRGR